MSDINQAARDIDTVLYLSLSPSIDLPDDTIQLFDLSVNPWSLPDDTATVEFDVEINEANALSAQGRAS